MSNRDDMVIRVRLEDQRAAAPVRAREERRLATLKNRRGKLRRLAQARAAQKLAKRRTAARIGARRVAVARGGTSMVGRAAGMAARGGMVAARATPVGLIITAVVVAVAVTARLASGRSFENMGQQLNNMFLGDMDEEARAAMQTRQRLGSDPDIARIIGQEGRVNSQVAAVFTDLEKLRKRELDGATLIRSAEGMQVNGLLDMLILRARDALVAAWNGSGGPDKVENLRHKMERPEMGAH